MRHSINKEDLQVKKAKLGSDDPRERAAAASDLASYGLSAAAYEGLAGDVAKLLDDDDAGVRAAACNVLADMGEAGALFVDKILVRLDDKHLGVRRMAVTALGAIGAAAGRRDEIAAALVDTLRDQGETQALVLQSLSAIGAEPYVDTVAGLLQSPHLEVRRAALQCLGGLRPGAAAAHAPVIADGLNEPLVRSYAFAALANLGQAAEGYLPAILPFLEDGDHGTRQAAVDTLGALASSVDKGSVLRIADLLGHQNPAFRATGAMALGRLGEAKAGSFAQAIRDLIYDDEQWEEVEDAAPALEVDMYGQPGSLQQLRGMMLTKPCCAAANALGKLGSRGQDCVTALAKQFVWSNDPDFKIACMEAFQDLGEKGAEYSNYIARCLKERSTPPHVRAAGLLVLGGICRRTEQGQSGNNEWIVNERVNTSLARIAEALTDQDPHVQVYAAYALGSAGPRAADYVGQLAGVLEDRSSHLIATAVKALGDVGPEAASHAGKVAALLEDERMPVRLNAAEALGKLGEESFAAQLAARLKDPSCEVRAAAALALGRLGQMQHVIAIARLLVDQLSAVRRGACLGLGLVALQSRQKLPSGVAEQLKTMLEDDVASVRDAAKEALQQVSSMAV